MIETCKAFKVGEQTYSTIEQAKTAAIMELGFGPEVSHQMVKYGAKIADILTTTPTSKPKARKVNGGTKTRKPKEAAVVAAAPANTPAA